MFKSALGIFLQKFPLLLNYILLDHAVFGFSESLGTTFGDLVALVVCFGALGCYGCLGLLGQGLLNPGKRRGIGIRREELTRH